MLIHLVKKDLILAKKYLLIMFVFTMIAPIFLYTRMGLHNNSAMIFLITVLYVEFILYNSISLAEDKYKGSSLLCTTPYTRNSVVKAKYLFVLIIFIITFVLYNVSIVIGASFGLKRLNLTNVGVSLLIVAIFYGILIPAQFKYGYEKTRFYFFLLIFIMPFLLPSLQRWSLLSYLVDVRLKYIPIGVIDWSLFAFSFMIGLFSMYASIRIFSEKNL